MDIPHNVMCMPVIEGLDRCTIKRLTLSLIHYTPQEYSWDLILLSMQPEKCCVTTLLVPNKISLGVCKAKARDPIALARISCARNIFPVASITGWDPDNTLQMSIQSSLYQQRRKGDRGQPWQRCHKGVVWIAGMSFAKGIQISVNMDERLARYQYRWKYILLSGYEKLIWAWRISK
jgi:hypothetical protein